MYIDDLIRELKDCGQGVTIGHNGQRITVLVYADDLILLSETESGLNMLLRKLNDWCSKWRVLINTSKTKVMHFRKKSVKQTNSKFMIGTEELEIVKNYRYLGNIIDEHCNSGTTAEALSSAGSRALGHILNKTRTHLDLGFNTFSRLYSSIVNAIMDYGSGAWSCGQEFRRIDTVQNRAGHFYCGLPHTCPIVGMMGELGWTPGMVRRDIETVRLYNQIMRMSENRLPKILFEYDVAQMSSDSGIWLKNVINILSSLDMREYWEERRPVAIKIVKEKLMCMYVESWKAEVNTKTKLDNYKIIKQSWGAAPQLRANLSKEKRSLVTKIRLGCLPLEVETGRYFNIERNLRICKLCNDECETELHFLFKCSKLSTLRENLYLKVPELLSKSCNISKLEYLSQLPHTFSNYLQKLWKTRNELI